MEQTQRPTTRQTAFFLLACMSIAFLTFLFILSPQSLRLDEAQNLWQSSRSTPGIVEIVARDVHVPLYHILLHYWIAFFGNDIGTARLLSHIFFLATIPAIYLLSKEALGRKRALFVTLLATLSPFLNWYGSETRMYSLLVLVMISHQYFLLRLLKSKERTPTATLWIGYAATMVIGMFTHYFFTLVMVTEGLYVFIYRKTLRPGMVRGVARLAIVYILLFAPWVAYVFRSGLLSNTTPLLSAPTALDVFSTYSQFLFGFQTNQVSSALLSLWPLSVLFFFLALQQNVRISPIARYFLFTSVIPVALTFLFSISVRPFYVSRYLIIAVPSLYLAITWLLFMYPPRISRVLRGAFIVAMAGSLMIQAVNSATPAKESYRTASDYLSTNASDQDIVVVSAPFTIYPIEYYYKGTAAITTIPNWNRLDDGPIPPFSTSTLPAQVETLAGDHLNAWLVLSYDQGYENDVKKYFETHYAEVEKHPLSTDLTLYKFRLRYDPLPAKAYTEPSSS